MTTERKKPSELTVIQGAAGEVIEVAPELSPVEKRLEAWNATTYRGSELLSMEPRSWLVPGWFPNDAVAAVYAPPGVGKSFYALTLALTMASGAGGVEQSWSLLRCCMSPLSELRAFETGPKRGAATTESSCRNASSCSPLLALHSSPTFTTPRRCVRPSAGRALA